jgi:hypothetical protein
MVGAPAVSVLSPFFCRSRAAVALLFVSGAFIVFGWLSELWTQKRFDAVGCTGTVLKGLFCDEMDWLTSIAAWHDTVYLYGMFYSIFLLPVIFVVAAAFEWRARALARA